MTVEQKINMATAYKGISQAELARLIGISPANFNLKVKRGTLRQEDLEKVAIALGAVYQFGFIFEDGTKI
ncbi:MAG: helix-turn-helix transcriptional regulator [Defluviitaleaceae bacterium]|nr:helix-turn-helix transcriptional regulator [Defluviitaleaceae bacterium]